MNPFFFVPNLERVIALWNLFKRKISFRVGDGEKLVPRDENGSLKMRHFRTANRVYAGFAQRVVNDPVYTDAFARRHLLSIFGDFEEVKDRFSIVDREFGAWRNRDERRIKPRIVEHEFRRFRCRWRRRVSALKHDDHPLFGADDRAHGREHIVNDAPMILPLREIVGGRFVIKFFGKLQSSFHGNRKARRNNANNSHKSYKKR